MPQRIQIKKKINSPYPHVPPTFVTVLDIKAYDPIKAFFTQRGFTPDRPGKISRISIYRLRDEIMKEIKKSTLNNNHLFTEYHACLEAIASTHKDDELYCFYETAVVTQ